VFRLAAERLFKPFGGLVVSHGCEDDERPGEPGRCLSAWAALSPSASRGPLDEPDEQVHAVVVISVGAAAVVAFVVVVRRPRRRADHATAPHAIMGTQT
jgi:hypothetical protein